MSLLSLFLRNAVRFAAKATRQHELNDSHDTANLGNASPCGFSVAPKTFGDFEEIGENPFVRQESENTCAIKSQQMILEKFGIDVPESDLALEAEMRGWFNPDPVFGGTAPEDVGKLLEAHGIPVNRFTDANIFTLQNELCQGHQVIVSVDSEELWHGIDTKDAADHALIVSNIDTTDVSNPKVVLKDPGTGYVEEYPWSHFESAWEDGDCFMVSTKIAPPVEFAPEMCNFNYAAGALEDFDGFSYSSFLAVHGDEIQLPQEEIAPVENSDFDGNDGGENFAFDSTDVPADFSDAFDSSEDIGGFEV